MISRFKLLGPAAASNSINHKETSQTIDMATSAPSQQASSPDPQMDTWEKSKESFQSYVESNLVQSEARC